MNKINNSIEYKLIELENDYYKYIKKKAQCCWSNCLGTAKKSHTVSESQLRKIAKDGHVYLIKESIKDLQINKLLYVGVGDALTFGGFCSRHEALFNNNHQDIDIAEFIPSLAPLETVLYRLLCKKIKENEAYLSLKNNSIDVLLNPNKLSYQQVFNFKIDLVKMKIQLESYLSNLVYYIPFGASKKIISQVDETGNQTRSFPSFTISHPNDRRITLKTVYRNIKLFSIGTTHTNFFSSLIPNDFGILIHVYYHAAHSGTEFSLSYPENHPQAQIISQMDNMAKQLFCVWHLIKNKEIILSPFLSDNQIKKVKDFKFAGGNWQNEIAHLENDLLFLLTDELN